MTHPIVDAHVHVYPVRSWGLRRKGDHEIAEYGTFTPTGSNDDGGDITQAASRLTAEGVQAGLAFNLFEPDRVRTDVTDLPDAGAALAPEIEDLVEACGDPRAYLFALNRWLCAAVASEPRLFPVVAADPGGRDPEGLAEHVHELVSRRGAVGVKLHPILQRITPEDRRLAPLYAACAELEVPVIAHAGRAGRGPDRAVPRSFVPMLGANPRLTVVLAHLGGAAWREVRPLARRFPNVFFDCAEIVSWVGAPNAPTPADLVDLIRSVGHERVLFGSDYPWYSPGDAVSTIRSLPGLSEDQQASVLGVNAVRLFRLAIQRPVTRPVPVA